MNVGAQQALQVLERLSGFGREISLESRDTLSSLHRDYIERGRPAEDFLDVWDRRLRTWESLIAAYIATAGLDPAFAGPIEAYEASLLAWIELLKSGEPDATATPQPMSTMPAASPPQPHGTSGPVSGYPAG